MNAIKLEQDEIKYPAADIFNNSPLSGVTGDHNGPLERSNLVDDPVMFWKEQLPQHLPRLAIPTDTPRSNDLSFGTDQISFTIPSYLTQTLKRTYQGVDANICSVLLTVYNVLLFRYTGQTEFFLASPTLGTPIGDTGEEAAQQTRFFYIQFAEDITFIDLLAKIDHITAKIDLRRDLSYDLIENSLTEATASDKELLYSLTFSYRDAPAFDGSAGRVPNRLTPGIELHSLDLAMDIEDTVDELNITLTYRSELFKAERIRRLATHFEVLLTSITKHPFLPIAKLKLLTDAEARQLTSLWNTSCVNYPMDKNMHELFEHQVAETPFATALKFGEQELTYIELNQRANQLACHLRVLGVKRGIFVPICIEPSLEMIVGLLAILKAGGAYVPLDPENPEDRLGYLLEDTKAELILCDHKSKPGLAMFKDIRLFSLTDDELMLKSYPTDNFNIACAPTDLAYVIYTSGTAGKPKGVMIQHSALIDHCYGVIDKARLNDCRSFAFFAPLTFDAGHSIIHSCFITGACLHVLPKKLIMDSRGVRDYLEDNAVDLIKIVPSLWLFYAGVQQIALAKKVMIFGGETFPLSVLEYLRRVNYTGSIYNHYGPTEATIGKCMHEVDINKNYHAIPIGRPFSNTRVYVLDDALQVAPIGIPGELYIAGAGLAAGYLNLSDLTTDKFVSIPVAIGISERMYKTGDKVRWLPDGNIEYLGRVDEQIKINGYRIEPGEIEEVILQSGMASHALVLAIKDKKGSGRLVQYIVPTSTYDKEGLTDLLKKKLPAYMVPASCIEVKSLPLTKNGKVDKKQLANLPDQTNELKAPVGSVEIKLAAIWRTELEIDKIGANDNFFELGGNSLIAAVVFAKIKEEFKKDLPLATIFNAPTIRLLAGMLTVATERPVGRPGTIVPIQPHGTKTPLFCVHAGHGHVLFYANLSLHLGNDQPFYGIQARGIDGTDLPFAKMEDMAAYYIAEMRKVQPEGPYYLGGYCLGALIAFEMAQQLTAQHQQIALLASFNGRSPFYRHVSNVCATVADNHHAKGVAKLYQHYNKFAALNWKGKFDYVAQRVWVHAKSKLMAPLFAVNFKVSGIIFKLCLSAKLKFPDRSARRYTGNSLFILQCNYRPKTYSGDMVVFRSPGIYTEPCLGWRSLVDGEIETLDIPGEHETRRDILNEPYVKSLAKSVKSFLPR